MLGMNLVYLLLGYLGLSFLVFIHELGHYWMARHLGIPVETFSVGFGKPIYTWLKDGVKWQIGWLPFGGYVKIAEAEGQSDNAIDPYDVPPGLGYAPWNKIKVAIMGPAVNLLFALLAFALLWALGGREKSFSEVTSKIGWVDPHSELYTKGVRPGDAVVAYDGKDFQGSKDHVFATLVGGRDVLLDGVHEDYATGIKTPFQYAVKNYTPLHAIDGSERTLGIMSPANQLIYKPAIVNGKPLEGTPIADSGITPGERVVWVDGELIFSTVQLNNVLNDGRALLTIERNGTTKLARVPRVPAAELKFTPEFKEELTDWQFESDLKAEKPQNLYVIPYNLNNDCVVEGHWHFIDADKEQEAFTRQPFSPLETPLQPNDVIIAIDGQPVKKSYELLRLLQTRKVNIIVQRENLSTEKISSENADEDFDKHLDVKQIELLAKSIGTGEIPPTLSSYALLNPITPVKEKDLIRDETLQQMIAKEQDRLLKSIDDKDKRARVANLIEQKQNKLVLGLAAEDKKVKYNPSPLSLFSNVTNEIFYTLEALFTGAVSPKFLSGPVGIIQVVQNSWHTGAKEALFWLGTISINLGILNLLPIPVVDGGTIALSLVEIITRRRFQPKTLEKIIFPFAMLLIGFFIFITYHDIVRTLKGFF